MNQSLEKYIVVVEGFKESLLSSLLKLRQQYPEYNSTRFLLLTTRDSDAFPVDKDLKVIQTDFSAKSIRDLMANYSDTVIAVLCRGDKYVQYLRKVIPFLPMQVRVASDKSLEITTNKRLMRQVFSDNSPELSPSFLSIVDNSQMTVNSIEKKVGYPAIIKPASLASSVLIQKINNRAELSSAISNTLRKISAVYRSEGRSERPELIVEEFMEGDFYSIDSYVLRAGQVFHLPMAGYLPAESIGIDDFFLYKRWTPVDLPDTEVAAAQHAVEKAIQAVGLEWSSVHAELIKTQRGWRIIEIGPRIGRFRNTMYQTAFGVDHGYNDILIHLGKQPILSDTAQGVSLAYSIYPHSEGVLESIEGLDVLDDLEEVIAYKMVDSRKIEQTVKSAKNGGHALLEVVFSFSENGLKPKEVTDCFESRVYAKVREEKQ